MFELGVTVTEPVTRLKALLRMFGLMSSSNRRHGRQDRPQGKNPIFRCLTKNVSSWRQIAILLLVLLVVYFFHFTHDFASVQLQKTLEFSSKLKGKGIVANIAFSKLLKVTVPEKTHITRPRIRSFGSYSENDNL